MLRSIFLSFSLAIFSCETKDAPRYKPFPLKERSEARVFFIGHSLVSFEKELQELAKFGGVSLFIAKQSIGGSSLKNHWLNPQKSESLQATQELSKGNYDTLILTERVLPLSYSIEQENSAEYASKFANLARSHKQDIRVYVYETWHSLTLRAKWYQFWKTDWRKRLHLDVAQWQKIADEAGSPERAAPVIPVGQAVARIYDLIKQGEKTPLSSIDALFSDTIHLGPVGNYLVACVHYSMLFGKSPIGHKPEGISPELAQFLQTIAWETVSETSLAK